MDNLLKANISSRSQESALALGLDLGIEASLALLPIGVLRKNGVGIRTAE